jgi:two-component system, LytTR family, response regulator
MRALIADDEPLARSALLRLLKGDRDLSVIGQCGDGESAVQAIQQLQPDLVFLDVQMPEMDGFQVVESIGVERMPVTIFVTAYDRYAIRAFDANAVRLPAEALRGGSSLARRFPGARSMSRTPGQGSCATALLFTR